MKTYLVFKYGNYSLSGGFNFYETKTGKHPIEVINNKNFYIIEINNDHIIKEFKFTNSDIEIWNDIWIGEDEYALIQPSIEKINLSRNDYLQSIVFNTSNKYLKEIKANNNKSLEYLDLSYCNNLEKINLVNCPSITNINFGKIPNVSLLDLRNSNLGEEAQVNILGNFYPKISTASYITPYKIKYNSVLDLRGNNIFWENRLIASKIRMLLCNFYRVIWDNPPPDDIVPIDMYKNLII